MSIHIISYTDPYSLNQEKYWAELTNCPYFCAAQTLVNGMKRLYRNDFQRGNITTIQNLIEALFPKWVSTAQMVKQHTILDNIIHEDFPDLKNPTLRKNMQQAFQFNREELFESLRTMSEFEINTDEILIEKLSEEQKIVVDIYKKILTSDQQKEFKITDALDETAINSAIKNALAKVNRNQDAEGIAEDCIVIHGIHQFTPLILRAIDVISQYKKIVLLFNYQEQYKNVYQTWIDVYSAFDSSMAISQEKQFRPSMDFSASYQGNVLGDHLGRLVNGQLDLINGTTNGEILEFDNLMEFAGYVATLFEQAGRISPENPLGQMKEQIYAADNSVNKILRVYFPEQFGERHFLDYPLGHFFVAVANLWKPDTNTVMISDLNDIKECLSAGILKEEFAGQLLSTFCRVQSLFDGCETVKEMQDRLKRVKKNRKRMTEPEINEEVSHISYYSVEQSELDLLVRALDDLVELSSYFYEDFDKQANNFRNFYRKLKLYLQDEVMEDREIDDEFSDIIRRVLSRLEEVQDIEASASFECLKSTMSIYLTQETKPGGSANWIVRNFEQIDGDILRSLDEFNNHKDVTYHFACLTDEEIDSVNRREFPWPLNDAFFEIAQNPVDWKYQVYVRAKKEYKNFKRYALIYGLEFNRCKFKLSYVKRDGETDRTPYYLLKILGYQAVPNKKKRLQFLEDRTTSVEIEGIDTEKTYSQYDYYRYKICPYKFLLETLIEETTVYKDNFLQIKYLEILLENRVRRELQGYPVSEVAITEKIDEIYGDLKRIFPFARNVSRMDSVKTIRKRLLDTKQKTFPEITENELQYMMIRELFIHKQLSDQKTHRKNVLADKFPDVSKDQIKDALSEKKLSHMYYLPSVDVWCQYCANREICVEYCTRVE